MTLEQPLIIFFMGASGTGKTTVLENFAQEIPGENILFERFDVYGIPSLEEMVKDYESPRAWRNRRLTFRSRKTRIR